MTRNNITSIRAEFRWGKSRISVVRHEGIYISLKLYSVPAGLSRADGVEHGAHA
jgi:hypothetical protein